MYLVNILNQKQELVNTATFEDYEESFEFAFDEVRKLSIESKKTHTYEIKDVSPTPTALPELDLDEVMTKSQIGFIVDTIADDIKEGYRSGVATFVVAKCLEELAKSLRSNEVIKEAALEEVMQMEKEDTYKGAKITKKQSVRYQHQGEFYESLKEEESNLKGRMKAYENEAKSVKDGKTKVIVDDETGESIVVVSPVKEVTDTIAISLSK